MRKLIIGCGYLGRRVAREWLAQGDHVAAMTRSASRAEDFRRLGIEPIVGDVTDPAALAALPAAEVLLYAVGFDRTAGPTQREVYVDGLSNVLSEITTRVDRVIYISSTSVYGQSAGEWVDETSPTVPTRPNGQVCLAAEQTLWRHLPPGDNSRAAQVLRLAGIYGPGRLLQRSETLKSHKPLGGNPAAYLNLIHVADAVRAVLGCEAEGEAGETYLVCDDRPIRRREYYEKLAALLEAPAPRYEELPTPATGQSDLNKRCSNRKLHELLNVQLRYPDLDSGLPHAVEAAE